MSKTYHCDLHGDRLCDDEVSVIRVTGPLASILKRRELHVGKPGAYDLAEFFHHVVARPEGMEADLAVRRKALDSTTRARALQSGQAAGSRPPRGKANGRGGRPTPPA